MKRLWELIETLREPGAFLHRFKKRRRSPSVSSGRKEGPRFTASSAVEAPKRVSVFQRIRARFRSSAQRRELNRSPVAVRGRYWGLVIGLLVVLATAFSLYMASGPLVGAVADMKFFRIREISITGCRTTTPSLIREIAGIRYQGSLLALNPDHVEAIVRVHPWVAEVKVRRDWPDRLVVAIREYQPVALIARQMPGGASLFYLDGGGVAFAPVEPGRELDFPVITGLSGKVDAAGLPAACVEALALLKLIRQNNPNLPLQNLSEIHVDPDAGLTIYLADHPFPIHFGVGAIRTKYSRLKRVLEVLYRETGQGMTIADVAYIRMDYLENKVLVAHSGSG